MLTLLPALVLLGCQIPSPSDRCAGFAKITGADASVVWLAQNDPQFLKAVIAHDEFGAKQGCWK